MLQFLALFETETLHDFRHAIGGAEVAHEIVLETDIKARPAGITLPRATSAQLPVDATRLVPLRANNEKSAPVRNAIAELNVGAAAGHVGGNRHGPRLTRALHDFRLLHVVLGVEDVVRYFFPLQHPAEQLGSLHAHGADQNRLGSRVAFLDLIDDGIVFFAARLVD